MACGENVAGLQMIISMIAARDDENDFGVVS
jgi:hypothetical protein